MSANNRHRRLGDRKEGRRLRTITPLMAFTPFIMIDRNDACNQFAGSVEISETDRWLRAKRAEGYKGLGMVHLFIAAYIRVLCHLPGLNRFVSGQRVYARNNIYQHDGQARHHRRRRGDLRPRWCSSPRTPYTTSTAR